MSGNNKLELAVWTCIGLAAPVFGACNMVTGADGIVIADEDDDETSGAGQGGATTAGPGATNGAGGDPSTVGAGGMATSSGTQGVGAGPTSCEYPAGPYGVGQGQVVPPTISWQGYAPGASAPSTITMESLFDCDGSKNINAIVVDTSQFG